MPLRLISGRGRAAALAVTTLDLRYLLQFSTWPIQIAIQNDRQQEFAH
jgi:hypothetical protein